jgi:hypothetical protein
MPFASITRVELRIQRPNHPDQVVPIDASAVQLDIQPLVSAFTTGIGLYPAGMVITGPRRIHVEIHGYMARSKAELRAERRQEAASARGRRALAAWLRD